MAGDHLEFSGKVVDVQKGKFKVEINSGITLLAKLSGKMQQNKIRVVLGDTVIVKVSPYDTSHGILVKRL